MSVMKLLSVDNSESLLLLYVTPYEERVFVFVVSKKGTRDIINPTNENYQKKDSSTIIHIFLFPFFTIIPLAAANHYLVFPFAALSERYKFRSRDVNFDCCCCSTHHKYVSKLPWYTP